ncbi:hypothetical protein [Roseicella sp. DB1501]|uniref:hypothetical protein n=1 Tax=Roseicella sp. DB1501 TaxID=2730925 RepID=UPI0014913E0E|nr:hypothetical protein [Roseicella sp. DB1501]NOG73692.1 hypothetical protein [Roseicella sp. DB1501]
MRFRTALLAALASLPLLAGAASAHGGWSGGPGHDWRAAEAHRARIAAARAHERAWHHRYRMPPPPVRYAPPPHRHAPRW